MRIQCRHPGCKVILDGGGWCDKHRPPRRQKKRYENIYSTSSWKRIRLKQLSTSPLCQRCEFYSLTTIADDVDHVIPHRGDLNLFRDAKNLQSLCHRCHSWKTNQERKGKYFSYRDSCEEIIVE